MAASVPGVDFVGVCFPLRATENAGIADFLSDQERGDGFCAAADRCVHAVEQPEESTDFAVWLHGWARGGVVHWTVLCTVLFVCHFFFQAEDGIRYCGHRIAVQHAVLYSVWVVI